MSPRQERTGLAPAGSPHLGHSASARWCDAPRGARGRRFAAVLCLWALGACAATSARGEKMAAQGICPKGTHNYGDGMVASMLPDQAREGLEQAHATAIEAAAANQSSFLADQPWRPHVSVIYGVTQDKAIPAQQALQSFLATHKPASACFGGLQYWDDTKGGKTTLVLDVHEPRGVLTSLHDALAEGAHIGSRFAYHPHVTLLYLQLHTRLNAAQEAAILAPLQGVCWPNSAFYVTDPCGQEIYRAKAASEPL